MKMITPRPFLRNQIVSLLSLFVLFLSFQNCSKLQSSSLSSEDSVVLPSFFQCNPKSGRLPNQSELKRLNKFELENTIHDLFSHYLSAGDLKIFMSNLETHLTAIPDEDVDDGLDYFDQSLSFKHLDKIILLAEKVAETLIAQNSYRNAVLGPCATNMNDATCMRSFLSTFGRLALRGQLSNEDITWYSDVFTGHPSGYENLIASILSSPKFVYHFEIGEEGSNESNIRLTSYEKASRLSYFILQSMPDDLLLEAASDGELSPEEVKQHTSRLMSLPLAKKRLTKSLANQIFKISHTPDIRRDIASLNSMVGDIQGLTSLEDLKNNMIQEVYDYVHYVLWETNGTYEDLMTMDYVFPRTTDLANIYGTNVWNGKYSKDSLIKSPSGERSGILTRAQQLVSGSGNTGLIHRGVKVFKDFLCGQLPAPADTDPPEGAVILDTHSGREVVQSMTEVRGTSCVGCHKNIINPLGIPFESFDPLGRFRFDENIYHPEESSDKGKILTVKKVNTKTEIFIGEDNIHKKLYRVQDLTSGLASSPKSIACFNNSLWSFATKQPYRLGENDCASGSLYKNTVRGRSIVQTLSVIPMQPEFFKRKLK